MAIRFLNALNIDGTITATINQDANAGYDGILVSTSGLIERRTKAQILADIGAGTGSMDNFVAAASAGSNSTIGNGDTLTIAAGTGVSTTNNGSGTITITATGSSYSGWELAGDSGSAQDISSGNTATFAGGDVISTVASATDTLTINHDAVSRTDTTSSASPGYGGTVDVVNTVSTTSEGHVTAIDLQTITFPAAENYTWTLAGDSGSGQTISSGDSATFQGGSAIVTEAKNTDTLEISLDIDGLTGATVAGGDLVAIADVNDSNNIKKVTAQSIADLAPQGDITAVQASTGQSEEGIKVTSSTGPIPKVGLDIQGQTNIGAGNLADEDEFIVHDKSVTKNLAVTYKTLKDSINAAGYNDWILQGDSGVNLTVTDGDVVDIAGGTGITTATSATGITLTNSLPFNSITLAASTGSNSTIANSGTITIAAGSNISTTNNGSGTVTIAYTGGTGSMSSWTLAAESGTNQTVNDGETVTFEGDSANDDLAGITTQMSSPDKVVIHFDPSKIETVTALDDPDTDQIIYYDSNNVKNQQIAVSNIHINELGKATADVDFDGNKLKAVATGTAGTDGVNLAQVQSIAAGVGIFRGGYNASTNSPALTGGSNIALDQGDFFAVTTGGSFFTETLEVGDLIFANSAIAASSTPSLSDYTIVQSGQSIAGVGATDGATVKGVAGFDSAVFTATASGWIQLIDQGITPGSIGGASKSLTVNFDKFGVAQSASEQNISITASQVSDFCTAVSTCIAANEQYSDDIGGATSITVNHGLGTRDVMVQLYDNTTFDTVYADVTRNAVGQVTVDFTTAPAADAIRILITKVS